MLFYIGVKLGISNEVGTGAVGV